MEVQNDWRRLSVSSPEEEDEIGQDWLGDQAFARSQQSSIRWLGEGQVRPLLWRLLFCHFFAMDSPPLATGHYYYKSHFVDHLACCAADMIAVLFCIALLRRALGFDVFASPSSADPTADAFRETSSQTEEAQKERKKKRVHLISKAESVTSLDDDEDDYEDDDDLQTDGEDDPEDEDVSAGEEQSVKVEWISSKKDPKFWTDDETEEDSRLDISSYGNYSFGSNRAEASTCYYESGVENAADIEEEEERAENVVEGQEEFAENEDAAKTSECVVLSEASAFLLASVAATAPEEGQPLPDFPSPVCDDDDEEEANDEKTAWPPNALGGHAVVESLPSARSASSSSDASQGSSSSSCPSLDSRCSWFREHYGEVYEKALLRRRQKLRLLAKKADR